MRKELVLIYDTPSEHYTSLIERQNILCYLRYFDKITVLYWSRDRTDKKFLIEEGRLVFFPYSKAYNSGYMAGLKYMLWIGKALWRICRSYPQETKLIFIPIAPIWPGVPSLVVGKLKGKKVVLRSEHPKIEGLRIEEETLGIPKIFTETKVLILKIIYFLTIPFYDLIVGISNYVLQEAKNFGAKKTIWIPMVINTKRFRPRAREKNKIPVVLSVGQIKKRKGFEDTIKALHLLKKETGFNPKLLIVGRVTNPQDEIFLQKFKNLAKGLNVEFRLNVESHDELARVYNEVDVLVSASYIEGLCMVVMEAMASGLPVIATGNSGTKDVVEDGKTGFLIEPKDPQAIKEKLVILLENPGLRESMGKAGRKRIEELMRMIDERRDSIWK